MYKTSVIYSTPPKPVKYLGLLAMSKILKTHPKSVQAHKDLILACLDDKDESIRLRALDLLYGMVSKRNLMQIVRCLLGHMERAEGSAYRDELLYKVIEICAQGSYQYVTNFEWYLTVLVELIQLETGSKHGGVIATQLLDVAIRVQAVRAFAVAEMTALLESFPVVALNSGTGGSTRNSAAGGSSSATSASASWTSTSGASSMYEVLYAAAWIVGEFAGELSDPERSLNVLLQPRQLPGHIQAVYVQNVLKLFAHICTTCLERGDVDTLVRLSDVLLGRLPAYLSSGHIEVQERASSAFVLVHMLRQELRTTTAAIVETTDDILEGIASTTTTTTEDAADNAAASNISLSVIDLVQELALMFAGDLNPVAPKAQRKVQLPDGLDLDEWINAPVEESSISSSSSSSGGEESHNVNVGRSRRRHNIKPEHLFVSSGDVDINGGAAGGGRHGEHQHRRQPDPTTEELAQMRRARQLEQSFNPNYLKSEAAPLTSSQRHPEVRSSSHHDDGEDDGYEDVPIAELALDVPLNVGGKFGLIVFMITRYCRSIYK